MSTAPLGLTPAQLERRRTGIGGSDIAPVASLSPYRSAYDVWLDKCGFTEPFAGNAP